MKLIDLLVRELPKRGGWPEGAGACAQDNDGEVCFYTEKGIHRRDGWREWSIPQGCDSTLVKRGVFFIPAEDMMTSVVCHEQYEAALAASKQGGWNGDGLPPVGCKCEHCPGGTTQTEWEVVTVAGIYENPITGFTDYWLVKENGSSYTIGNPYRFRTIRSEAERKREEVIAAMRNFATNYNNTTVIHAIEKVYDAIAAGKIPGVRLADESGN